MVRKLRKNIKDIASISLMGAGTSIGLSALGGSSTPIVQATKFLPATGAVVGASSLLHSVSMLDPKKRRRR